jgi:hypothetical protein
MMTTGMTFATRVFISLAAAAIFACSQPVVAQTEIFGFDDLLSNLEQGYTIRFVVDYNQCHPSLGPAVGSNIISDFEWFNDPVFFGPEKIEFSQAKLISNYQGSGFVYDYVKTTVYRNGTVIFFASDVHPNDFSPVYEETTSCLMSTDSGVGNVHFFYTDVQQPQQLGSFTQLIDALTQGHRVRVFNNYTACSIYEGPFGKVPPQVTAGQEVTTIEYFLGKPFTSQPFFAYSENNLIKNYNGLGFLQDVVETQVFQNNSVVFRVQVLNAQTYEPQFREWFLCSIDDGEAVTGIKYYLVA